MNADASPSPGSAPLRVVVTGSECTGKSTLARALGAHFAVEVVPEFVRTFAETMGGRVQFSDHGPIARGQMGLEDQYRERAGWLLIHDTDLLSTVQYCRHHFGRCPEWIEAESAARRPDLYLVCDIDVPWVADGLRDRGHRREEMHALFVDAVKATGLRWEPIRGSPESRLGAAIGFVEALRA